MTRKDWTNERLFDRLLNSKSDRGYWDNIKVLRARPTQNVYDTCIELVHADNTKAKEIAINVLSQLGTTPRPFLKETIKLFFNLLHKETEAIILGALIYGIGHNNNVLNEVQVRDLCSFQYNSNSLIKEALVFALGGIDDENALEALTRFSYDKSNQIRNWATFSLGSLTETDNPDIRKALWDRVNDKHHETRLEAIVGLAIRQDKRVIDIIKREIEHGEHGTLLFEAIVSFPNDQYLPLLEEQLEQDKTNEAIDPEWILDLENCINQIKVVK